MIEPKIERQGNPTGVFPSAARIGKANKAGLKAAVAEFEEELGKVAQGQGQGQPPSSLLVLAKVFQDWGKRHRQQQQQQHRSSLALESPAAPGSSPSVNESAGAAGNASAVIVFSDPRPAFQDFGPAGQAQGLGSSPHAFPIDDAAEDGIVEKALLAFEGEIGL